MGCDRTHRKVTSAHAKTDHLNVESGLGNASVIKYRNSVKTEIYVFNLFT